MVVEMGWKNRIAFPTFLSISVFGIQIRSRNSIYMEKLILKKSWKDVSQLKFMEKSFQEKQESF